MTTSPAGGGRAELAARIDSIRVAMFTTVDQHGHLTSHPMTRQAIDAQGDLWFFTSDQTGLWHSILAQPNVNLSFAEPDASLYVSISGRAEQVRDAAKIKELWNPLAAAWFPGGIEDPHLALVRVVAGAAEYWDAKSSRMVQLFSMLKSAITGTPPPAGPGEHGKLNL